VTLSAKKTSVLLAGLALVLLGGLIFLGTQVSRGPLATVALGDGRILQVEGVTYGIDHHIGNRSSRLLWRLTAWLPGRLYERLAPKNPESNIGSLDSPALVVWVNAVSEGTGTNVDCQGIRVELVSEQGEHFESATSSWSGGQKFWRVGHVFKVYPRNESKLTMQVTTWKDDKTNQMEFPNPHVVRPEAWTGLNLPQQKQAGDLTIVLAGLRLRTDGVPPKYYVTRSVYWEPVWELRRGREKLDGWNKPEWLAEDPLGNQGKYLGTNQPVLRFSASFYPAATNTEAAQLLATLPQTAVTNQQSIVWWNQTVQSESNTLSVLGLFPAGNYVFQEGVLLTNSPVSMGAVSGGAPSGWTGQSQAVNPLKVVHYNGHYSKNDSVIYVSAPKLGDASRLAMRLRDDQGRNWVTKPESQGAVDGIYPFLLTLPPEVNQVTPELLLLKPVEAEFIVKVPVATGGGGAQR